MFADRLKTERKRLKLNQEEFAIACGVTKFAQFNYEKGKRKPDSEYLEKAHKLGVDIQYLITGQPMQITLSTDEAFLLQEFRTLSTDQKKLMLRFLVAGFDSLNKSVINSPHSKIENSFNN